MTSTISIRYATREDAHRLVEFNKAMAYETESKNLIEKVISAGVETLFSKPELGFYVVAEQDNKVVGSLMVTTEWSDWRNGTFWWIQSVYVAPESRRQGIYRRLYEFVKAEAENNINVCGFRLYVEQDNLSAQQTYKALGMNETAYKLYEELKSDTKFFEKAA